MKALTKKNLELLQRGHSVCAELTPSRPELRKFIGVHPYRQCESTNGVRPPDCYSRPLWFQVSMFEIERVYLHAVMHEDMELHEKRRLEWLLREVKSEQDLDQLLLELVGDSVIFRNTIECDYPD